MNLLAFLTEHPFLLPLLVIVPVLVLIGLGGAALLAFLLAPERHRRAVDRVGSGVLPNLLVGLLVLVPAVLGLGLLHRHGIAPGRGLLWLVLVAALALGVGVCARRLGERALPEAHPLRQLALGLVAVLTAQLLPVCWPLLVLAGALGLGAWLRAGRPAVVAASTAA